MDANVADHPLEVPVPHVPNWWPVCALFTPPGHMCALRAFGNLCRAVLGAIVYILAAPAVGWSDF